MKTIHVTTIALIIGATLGFGAQTILTHSALGNETTSNTASNAKASNEPLYWVAPMNPSYKRDKPGKSPMGMDLIPVYAEDGAEESKPGTVTIDPSVENNLGVKVVQAQLTPLSPSIDTVGYIVFDESRLWQINVRVAGWVEKLNVSAIGDKVNQGDVLFTLYSPELVKAQEELLNAYLTGRRGLIKGATERLITLGVDLPQIQSIVKRGRASQSIDIKAKADGIIASLNVREGGYLSPAQTVISAGSLDNVWVVAQVFERQSQWVKVGSKAKMKLDALPGQEWDGEIDYVYPILDPQTRTLRLRLKFPNPQGKLKPNMFANITLQTVTDESVLTIPKSAVIRSGGMTRVVLSEGDGKFRSARIRIGREAGNEVEVLEGLTDKSNVVSSAQFLLDSESSQSADLSRIDGVSTNESVWLEGNITMLMKDFGMITLKHLPVFEWHWNAGEMNFKVDPDVELSGIQEGDRVRFLVEKDKDNYSLKDIEHLGGEQ
ncbi:efflux RND transporter periplasmic adaptor subunit [Vibrio parahaemolyticus]|uniref:efflux RND transporter periplasmic adaptor subunit n=1 Tax=Vibrio parahaemolyticus TaxID=670 RepID=UPI000A3C7703|nr:efflux RND transporter periplasmic adaptor subunit [Vibrio parahaemolyticus]OUJ60865.1 efflux transporter periplasmic adaptor subunit [Vibrio parahaemolyticus]TOA38142.1 efflux RND transporter periplasmic adaptor subunit [Vibrio parahaemolyticus]HCH6177436.1 efflux RND transporter periplasmic adaptor subunit [Vibrio parahaemolyticus]